MSSTSQPEPAPLPTRRVRILEPLDHDNTLTVRCGSRTCMLDEVRACRFSDFFRAACEGDFIESRSHRINLPEDDPSLMHNLFTFFGTLKYSIDRNDSLDLIFAWDISIHAQMYTVGDKFGVPRLKSLAAAEFKQSLRKFKERGRWDELRQDIYFKEFLSVVGYVFSSTPEHDTTLRKLVLNFLDAQIRHTSMERLRRIYQAVQEALTGKQCFAELAQNIQIQHHQWLSTLPLEELQGTTSDTENEVDLSLDLPSWLRGSA